MQNLVDKIITNKKSPIPMIIPEDDDDFNALYQNTFVNSFFLKGINVITL